MEPKITLITCNKREVGFLADDIPDDAEVVQMITLGKAKFSATRFPPDPPLGPPYPGYSMMDMIRREKREK